MISGNLSVGILVLGDGVSLAEVILIEGNFIGTDATGELALWAILYPESTLKPRAPTQSAEPRPAQAMSFRETLRVEYFSSKLPPRAILSKATSLGWTRMGKRL